MDQPESSSHRSAECGEVVSQIKVSLGPVLPEQLFRNPLVELADVEAFETFRELPDRRDLLSQCLEKVRRFGARDRHGDLIIFAGKPLEPQQDREQRIEPRALPAEEMTNLLLRTLDD
jgi:hypothetical protein